MDNKLFIDKIKMFIKDKKLEISFALLSIIYLAVMYSLFVYNPYSILNGDNKGLYLFSFLFGGFFLLILYFFFQKKKTTINNNEISNISFLMKIFSTIVLFALIVGLIFFCIYLFSNGGFVTNYILFILNIFIFFALIAFVIKYLKLNPTDYQSTGKPSVLRLFTKILFYIPCLLVDFSDFIKKEYNAAPRSSVIIIIVLTLLVILRFLLPLLFSLIINGNGKQLLKDPVYLDDKTTLGTFQDLNYKEISNDEKSINYKYAISSWIYLDSFPPSTNKNYEVFTSLLNIGNKPNLEVNIKKNKLKISMKTQNENKVIFETDNVKYQKWNHYVVNYDGDVTDVFLDGELVASVPGVIPYKEYDEITCGSEDGISGGICNVVYFNHNLSKNSIDMLYYASKNRNPPII